MLLGKFVWLIRKSTQIHVVRMFREKLAWFFLRKFPSVRGMKNSRNLDTTVFWELGGFTEIAKRDAVLARSLAINGKRTLTIMCDGTPRACMRRGIENNLEAEEWSNFCLGCTHEMETVLKRTGSSYIPTSRLITSEKLEYFENFAKKIDLNEALTYRYLGVTIGDYAFSSTVRYMKGFLSERDEIFGEKEEIFRLYFFAALVNTFIADSVSNFKNVVQGVTSHGGYTDYGPFLQDRKSVV